MKAADIGTVDPESLVDVTGILISSDGILKIVLNSLPGHCKKS